MPKLHCNIFPPAPTCCCQRYVHPSQVIDEAEGARRSGRAKEQRCAMLEHVLRRDLDGELIPRHIVFVADKENCNKFLWGGNGGERRV